VSTALYLDCFSGASGDMVLGACLDAGVPLAAVRDALGSLGLEDYHVASTRVQRAGIGATQWQLTELVPAPAGMTAADVEAEARQHHPHRHVAGIERLIARSSLGPRARERAIALVHRLAAIEAEIHGTTIDQVHLHEVGALDSIIDIVGGVFALEWFGAERIVASPLNLGSGTVRCAHGVLPVPAPATARLVTGVPVYQAGPAVELTTPTGALLVTGFAQAYGPMPPMRVSAIGYGAGNRDLPDRPNVLRLFVGEADARASETVTVLAFEVDDMNPQIYGVLMEALLAAGALDVYYTAVQMKKNRPGTLVTVLAPPARREALTAILFRETTTLGVRYHDVERDVLARETVAVQTPWGSVPVKVARFPGQGAGGGAVANAAPEFDACAAIARAQGIAVKDVQAAAMKAWLESSGRA
jgi:uncharacterized protein (TIGR00299 family) protein